jgi:cytochrome c-type biogenesis protein CcmE
MQKKTLVGLVAMIGFAGLLLFNFGSQVGGYMNFEQASENGARAHVVGTWVEDRPTRYDRTDNVFTFYMRDEAGTVRKVRYENPKPANFEEAEQVVVEGTASAQTFEAESILVKCPSKYNETKGLQQQTADASSPQRTAQP